MRNIIGKKIGYGWHYNYYAAANAAGLAPTGWRVSSQAEWDSLRTHLINTYGFDSNTVGGALKSTSGYWQLPNTAAVDTFGFAVLPAGNIQAGYIRKGAFFLTTTEVSGNTYTVIFSYAAGTMGTTFQSAKNIGRSVRCLQNKSGGEADGDRGTVFDIDGNEYPWVVMGDYRWMCQNLRTTRYADGSSITLCTNTTDLNNDTTGARAAYNFDDYYVYPKNK